MGYLTAILRSGMDFFYNVTGSYGLAIILVTILVRIILLPLTFSQTRSMKKMQQLQPEINKLKEKHKNDPQKLNQATMELWKQNKVNPLGGCLPMLLQFPIIIALFNVFQKYTYQKTPIFLGLINLALPDAATSAIQLGWPYLVLPILAAVTTYWQTVISTPGGTNDPSQKTMAYIFPVMIGWFSLRYPSGLSLYWVTSNIFSIVQTYLTPGMRSVPKPEASKSR